MARVKGDVVVVEVRHFAECGVSAELTAQALGMSVAAVAKALERAGEVGLSRPFWAALSRERYWRKDAA